MQSNVLPITIKVSTKSSLFDVLKKASNTPVILEQNGDRYRLVKEKKLKKDISFKAFLSSLGSWSDIDAEKMIEDIYRARQEGSRPITRP